MRCPALSGYPAVARDIRDSHYPVGHHHFRYDVAGEAEIHSVLLARTPAFHGFRALAARVDVGGEAIWQATIEDQPGDA